ncbi:hypothetical protein BD289DRAFT_487261 [Coniella lustricola]|uniref:Uncharacterized protein n=1 Tax=Coniella lustricola TaxID=2025994 RepID=A0A2T2ZSE4_9PEZI|nr:hypothetical protein BD289DRAFT_487261 [Coniella lustricola]
MRSFIVIAFVALFGAVIAAPVSKDDAVKAKLQALAAENPKLSASVENILLYEYATK